MNEDEAVEPQPEPIQLQPRVETKNIKKGKKKFVKSSFRKVKVCYFPWNCFSLFFAPFLRENESKYFSVFSVNPTWWKIISTLAIIFRENNRTFKTLFSVKPNAIAIAIVHLTMWKLLKFTHTFLAKIRESNIFTSHSVEKYS